MAVMVDSVTGNACPLDAEIVGGYVDGPYGPNDPYGSGWSAAAWARYPHAIHVTITVEGTPGARGADCESGAMTPQQTATWALTEIRAGRRPTVYGDAWDWANGIDQALAAVGLKRVRDLDGWVAHVGPAVIPAGFVACQYAQDQPGENGGRVDLSITNGVWPGVTPKPPPPAPSPTTVPGELFAMLASDPAFAVRYLYRICLHREVDPGAFTTDVNFLNGGGTLNQLMTNIQDSDEGQVCIAAERKLLGLP